MYTVRWKRTALDQLAELWLDAADRSEINAAVEEIDRLLGGQPHELANRVRTIFAFCFANRSARFSKSMTQRALFTSSAFGSFDMLHATSTEGAVFL